MDDYIAAQPEAAQVVLERVRQAIRKALPDAEEAISYCDKFSLDDMPEDVLNLVPTLKSGRQIHYLDRSVDVSGLDVASIPALRRITTAKVREVCKDEPRFTALVAAAPEAQQYLQLWCSYAAPEEGRQSVRAEFCTIKDACDWLGLSDAACNAVTAAVEA